MDRGIPTEETLAQMRQANPAVRYTKPEKLHHLLLDQIGFTLPAQPPPEIRNPMSVVETF